MLPLEEKINAIIEATPKESEFLERGFDKAYSKEILNDYTIKIFKEIDQTSDLLKQFRESVIYKGFSVFGFWFTEITDSEKFTQIGSLDTDLIVVLKKTAEVVLIEKYSEKIVGYLAKDFSTFLDLLPELINYDKIGFLGENYTIEIKESLKEKLSELNEDKYYSFYKNRIN